jgi:hypothetical protein
MWPYDLILFVAGLLLFLLVWYLRGRRHKAVFNELAPLLDADPCEMEVAGPMRGGEDHVLGRYKGRDVLFALKEPDRVHQASRFRVVLGSATGVPSAPSSGFCTMILSSIFLSGQSSRPLFERGHSPRLT